MFDEVGGLSSKFPLSFNDVDFCLKVRALDLRVVYDPDTVLAPGDRRILARKFRADEYVAGDITKLPMEDLRTKRSECHATGHTITVAWPPTSTRTVIWLGHSTPGF